jgi:hypothetical protein
MPVFPFRRMLDLAPRHRLQGHTGESGLVRRPGARVRRHHGGQLRSCLPEESRREQESRREGPPQWCPRSKTSSGTQASHSTGPGEVPAGRRTPLAPGITRAPSAAGKAVIRVSFRAGSTSPTPGQAGEFVRETGIDAPSASVGNIHELTRGRQRSIPIGPP